MRVPRVLPRCIHFEPVLAYLAQVDRDLDSGGSVEISLSARHNIEPAGAVLLATQLASRRQRFGDRVTIARQDYWRVDQYAYSMNLVAAVHAPSEYGRVGDLLCGQGHIKVQALTPAHLAAFVPDRVPSTYEMARFLSAELLRRLLPRADQAQDRAGLTLAVAEIVRNVLEHSGAGSVWVAGQYWPGSGAAEVAIGDTGVGIAASLRTNREYAGVADDAEGLRLAMLPGVSRSLPLRAEPRGEDDNAGYGLFVSSEYMREAGIFQIASGRACRIMGTREAGRTEVGASHIVGTVVRLRVESVASAPRFAELRQRVLERAALYKRQALRQPGLPVLEAARRFADFLEPA